MSKTIYFDNAATSFPKPHCVYKELTCCVKTYLGNPGRSSHKLSFRSAEKIFSAREEISKLLSVDSPESVVFTYNATHALNLAIKSFIENDCHVLTSDFEHNSVIRPLERLKETHGITYSCFETDGDIINSIETKKRAKTKGIICSIASNVTGKENSLKLLSDYANKNELFLIVDASQAIGHVEINLEDTPCDVLCAPGHKSLFGIQGGGFAYFKDSKRKNGIMEGGSGTDSINPFMPKYLPEGYEAGTPPTPAIVTLMAGTKFVRELGIKEISAKLTKLTDKAGDLLSDFPSIKIYGSGNGILSFNVADISSSYIASELDKHGICVRGGLHCAPSIHKKLGTLGQGAVRLSFSYLNKLNELDVFYKAIKEIISKI